MVSTDIRSEVVIRAPREKVWSALTTHEGWSGWFSDGVKGEFKVGAVLTLDFGKYGQVNGKVVEREELKAFAYKWHPGGGGALDMYPEEEMTTVRFTLADHADGTLVTMVESGFDAIPEARRADCIEMNTQGWVWELTEFRTFVEFGDVQILEDKKIVRERVYATSPEALWDLIATPEGMCKWFVTAVEGTFGVGDIAMLYFGPNREISGPLKVTIADRPRIFQFVSHPGQENGCTWDQYPESEATTTTFELAAVDGGTKLTISESGFENVPAERRAAAIYSNADGWTQVMDMIERAVG